jgi:hypothetical protein
VEDNGVFHVFTFKGFIMINNQRFMFIGYELSKIAKSIITPRDVLAKILDAADQCGIFTTMENFSEVSRIVPVTAQEASLKELLMNVERLFTMLRNQAAAATTGWTPSPFSPVGPGTGFMQQPPMFMGGMQPGMHFPGQNPWQQAGAFQTRPGQAPFATAPESIWGKVNTITESVSKLAEQTYRDTESLANRLTTLEESHLAQKQRVSNVSDSRNQILKRIDDHENNDGTPSQAADVSIKPVKAQSASVDINYRQASAACFPELNQEEAEKAFAQFLESQGLKHLTPTSNHDLRVKLHNVTHTVAKRLGQITGLIDGYIDSRADQLKDSPDIFDQLKEKLITLDHDMPAFIQKILSIGTNWRIETPTQDILKEQPTAEIPSNAEFVMQEQFLKDAKEIKMVPDTIVNIHICSFTETTISPATGPFSELANGATFSFVNHPMIVFKKVSDIDAVKAYPYDPRYSDSGQ